jgi:hypothetical protein
MRLIGLIGTTVLSLMLGASVPAQAQDQHDQQEPTKEKPAEQKEKKTQTEKPARQEDKGAQTERNAKPEPNIAERQQSEPGKQAQHNEGKRIPDERFRANFGRDHRFRVSEADYRRDRRFQYGGYWFGFVQPWPSNWLYTQDVYVVEIDGVYYLCNANYPGVNITLNVTM